MQTLRSTVLTVTVTALVSGFLAVGAVAIGITSERPGAGNPEPVSYSEPSWTDTSTLVIGGYETPSPEMIAITPPLSEQ
ncbi:hypothetical protein [Rathayibacter festucae]|uniref:DUF2613 domain-containing protein n=1 Tax=Rathayibacter festucae DSM 15932 TaxID=1328866 RepID=A0A3Q9UY49_9MICO|nr:hypothetical protein [Rathayibacter festucae]AZZ51919.1 hypothetical protein C1I64_07555 [Rathayibacter festucae DSM 15932]